MGGPWWAGKFLVQLWGQDSRHKNGLGVCQCNSWRVGVVVSLVEGSSDWGGVLLGLWL